MSEVTRLLDAAAAGDSKAAAELLPLVYDELRKLASARMAEEKPGQTLQPTGLVHEAYIRLIGKQPGNNWNGRGHFFAAAAEAMRRILIERTRRKRSVRYGGGRRRVDLDAVEPAEGDDDQLLVVDEALDCLAVEDPRSAELVKLRFFGGLSIEEAAEVLGIARSTAYEHWAFARASLRLKLSPE